MMVARWCVSRKVAQLIVLKHLSWVRRNVAPNLLVKLLQEEILGREQEADGVGAIQLSSQPLRTKPTQILPFLSLLLAILAEIFLGDPDLPAAAAHVAECCLAGPGGNSLRSGSRDYTYLKGAKFINRVRPVDVVIRNQQQIGHQE